MKRIILAGLGFAFVLILLVACEQQSPPSEESNPEASIEKLPADSIHAETGLVVAEGFAQVQALCTPCHSAKLITQNRASRKGWEQMIRWMQETQGLMNLGDNEPIILDYLAEHYAPQETGRRANLDIQEVQWYMLELE